jgi:hypothetical protein
MDPALSSAQLEGALALYRDCASTQTVEGEELLHANLDIDEHGSPVSIEPADWLVFFVPGLQKQWWHPFAHDRHKHCFVMRRGSVGYILVEPWWRRMMISTLTAEQARKFLIWGARGDVLLARENVPGAGSQLHGWMTCAAFTSYLLGRSYRVWTPHGLYRRLLREPGVRRVNPFALLRDPP